MRIIVKNYSGCRINSPSVKKNVKRVLKKLRKKWSVGVFFVSKRKIKGLNKKYRRKDRETDVLSFEMKEKGYLGDIIISPEVARENSKKYKVKYKEEIVKLTVHGVLHLLGYDHGVKKDKARMFRLQDKLIKEVWQPLKS